MSGNWNVLEPTPRVNYVICNLIAIPLWILSVLLPFAIILILLIPFFDSPILIIPGCIAFPLLFVTFSFTRIIITWILNWLATFWRWIRQRTGTDTPIIKISPDCFQFGQNQLIMLETDDLENVSSIEINLITRYRDGGDKTLEKFPTIASIIEPIMKLIQSIGERLPKPVIYDDKSISKQDIYYAKKVVKDGITSPQTIIPISIPAVDYNPAYSPLDYTMVIVMRVKLKSSSLFSYVEFYDLPKCDAAEAGS